MDLTLAFKSGDVVLIGVFLSLIVMSIATWCIMIWRFIALQKAKSSSNAIDTAFWQAENTEAAEKLIQNNDSPIAELVRDAFTARKQFADSQQKMLSASLPKSDFLEREIRHSYTKILNRYDGGLSVLASVGSTAPFIGLLGTVWGIYHALISITEKGQMSIAAVAGPIGEALVATAIGLFVAIPAVLGYNFFTRKNKIFARYLHNFAHDLHVYLINLKD